MMNRSDPAADSYIPSTMSYVGLEGSNNRQDQKQQQQHLWDDCWESHNATNYHHDQTNSFPPNITTPFMDCPHPLFPMNTFPFYASDFKREEGGGRIGLNLGHRTCFSFCDAMSVDRSRGSVYSIGHHYQRQHPRCQAEGCKADLSGGKQYHRRHKVCEYHSKASVVVAGGLQQRFCQQCSRFHMLTEFDEAKRSCRKRLADHNRRRRKPHPSSSAEDSTPKNPTTISSSKDKHISPCPNTETSHVSPAKSLEKQGLSHGSIEAVEEEAIDWSQSRCQHHQRLPLVISNGDQKISQQWQHSHLGFSPASTSNTLLHHHHSLFFSTSAGGGGQSSLLHLGQAFFEVDLI